MSKGFTCFICGGKLVMRSRELAVCESCSMEYSVDSLREEMTEKSAPAAHKTSNVSNTENLAILARSAYNNKEYKKAEQLCDQILMADSKNLDAWYWKIGCTINSDTFGSTLPASGYFADAAKMIERGSNREEFIKKVGILFEDEHKSAYLCENSGKIAKNLSSVDSNVAENYANICISRQYDVLYKLRDSVLSDLKKYSRLSADDYRYAGLMGRQWNNVGGGLKSALEELNGLICGYNPSCHIVNEAERLVELISDFTDSAYQYMGDGRHYDEIYAMINDLQNKLQKLKARAIKEEWERDPASKAKWEADFAEIKNKIDKANKKIRELNANYEKECADLNAKKNRLYNTLVTLGIFKGREKKKIKEEMALLDEELKKKEQSYIDALDRAESKLDEVTDKWNEINEMREIIETL